MAVLLAVGVLVMPGSPAMASVVLAAVCPSGPVTIGKLTSLDLVPGVRKNVGGWDPSVVRMRRGPW